MKGKEETVPWEFMDPEVESDKTTLPELGDEVVSNREKVERIELIDFSKRSKMERLAGGLFTCGFLLICIWVSRGSAWWTFFTASCFLAYCALSIVNFYEQRWRKFGSIEELIQWAEQQKGNEDEH